MKEKNDEIQSLQSKYEEKFDKKRKELEKSELRIFSFESQIKSLQSQSRRQESRLEELVESETNLKV